MLTAPELKIVFETLTKRRTALSQTGEGDNQANAVLLESAIGKIKQACTAPETGASEEGDADDTDIGSTDTNDESEPIESETIDELPEKLPDLSQLSVLITQDDAEALKTLQTILESMAVVNIETARSGGEALKSIFQAENPYDLILCGWNMPGKTGLEVHNTMRTDSRFENAIFILVSSISDGDQVRKAIQQGVNDYIVKPLDENILKRKIIKAYEKLQAKKRDS